VYKNVPAALTLDWTDGFLLKPFASPCYVFTYNFSQLKGSSDDGNATLTLQFQDPPGSNKVIEQVTEKIFSVFYWIIFNVFVSFLGDNLPEVARIAFLHARLFNG
jgi:hypothetical protein